MEKTDLEFEFYLATKLGMTVADVRERITPMEFIGWKMYYGRKAQRAELENAKLRRR
jgi:hypothetical protein